MIQTVTGEVDKRELGVTLPHEHILIDMTNCVNITGNEPKIFNEKISSENRHAVFFRPVCNFRQCAY